MLPLTCVRVVRATVDKTPRDTPVEPMAVEVVTAATVVKAAVALTAALAA